LFPKQIQYFILAANSNSIQRDHHQNSITRDKQQKQGDESAVKRIPEMHGNQNACE
jgi:hypothetical protein